MGNIMASKDTHITPNQHIAQMVAPAMGVAAEMPKPVVDPNQYLMKDNFGNYAFGYSTQNSEMSEVGNAQSKKGHFANIMADGKLRRVDYVADNQGFHILRDTADNTGRYIKREAEPLVQPDLIKTRMTSYMDSSSLLDDRKDSHSMSNYMMGRDMSSFNMPSNNRMSNMYSSSDMMNRDMTSNMMKPGMSIKMLSHGMTNNMMGHDMISSIMGPKMSANMMDRNRGMSTVGQTMYTNKMGLRDMTSNMGMSSLMRGQDMTSEMMERNMMGQDIYSNVMDNKNEMMSSSTMMGGNQITPRNRMSQMMQIETMPSQSLNRFF